MNSRDAGRRAPNAERPPLTGSPLDKARAGLDACVHCGFCLQSCPTYLALDDENDSPRGRLLLMKSMLEGALPADDPDGRKHFDRCLGCRACETACPSGVPYGHLLEATRATLTKIQPLPLAARLMLWVFAHPLLMHTAMFFGRVTRASGLAPLLASVLPGRLATALRMLEVTRPAFRASYRPTPVEARDSYALLKGCVMQGLFAHTNDATSRTLRMNGYRECTAPGQACCGALHAHAGDVITARRLAKRNIAAFENSGAEFVVSNAAGCGAMLKEYGHLLADEPDWAARAKRLSARARDVTELLADAGPLPGASTPARVTYDAPCHLLHAQRVAAPPMKVLAAIPGAELAPLADSDQCCGAAGIYNLLEPATSDAVLEPKLANIAATRADYVVTGNPGCLMQIGAGMRREGMAGRAVHPVDLLDEAYSRLILGR